ncbi:MAG TPA: ABC transporter ATP-binding protein [Acidimicrobiales bacterium]|nr:ABC transporter ATP-binding protein [Acidimicrobiales bacterium]
MTGPVLEIESVSRVYCSRRRGRPDVTALDGVSLSVEEGEIVAVVGESGAGKTTLARLVLGLERPDDGKVRLDGRDLAVLSRRELRAARQRMHMVFQDPYQSLHPGMRAQSIVAEPLAIRGDGRDARRQAALAALDEVALRPAADMGRRFPHQLSGGQRQRVALARAMVGRPRLVLADEPTSMLDASVTAGILELISAMRDRYDTAFLYITHDLAVARWVSDRMVVMRHGRVVEEGPSDDVVHRPTQEYTRLLLAASEGHLDQVPT